MSVNHGSIATHVPQSLPSFAQAFSTQSLGSISSGNNSLPPIQTRFPPMEHRRVNSPSTRPGSEDSNGAKTTSRKRTRNDITSNTRDEEHSNSDGSPRLVHIKEEQDQDMLEPTPPPQTRPNDHRGLVETEGAPPPSSLRPSPSKKRRVTISGGPHPLNTNVRVPLDQTNSTPISPVVMGFTIKRDNPNAIEQVRSMITVKQKQKALIEQRRGSVAGVMSPSTVTSNPIPPTPTDERNLTSSKPPASTRPLRRSPNTGTSARRLTNTSSHGGGNPRPPSPSPIIVPSQQPPPIPSQSTSTHSLPPPPISFAKRRASQLGSGKKKPADIVISPRETQTQEQFQPAIQSAPPVPHAGQSSFFSGRYPMALPRLPAVMGGGDNVRRTASNVPPTPTRLSMMQRSGSNSAAAPPISGIAGRSPPAASVPIASTLIPPTPGLFNHPGYSGDKAAFLAPFEVFYDALNDSKQLKSWLGEQLQRSNAMMQTLTQQQEKLNEVVETLVEQKVAGMRSEMTGLHRRVEELEDALRAATSGHRHSTDIVGGVRHKGKPPMRNGVAAVSVAPDTYTFPAVSSAGESSRRRPELDRLSSPGWGPDREHRDSQHMPESENDSPAPDSMRISVSSSRLDPPRSQHLEPPQPRASSSQSRPYGIQSPPQAFRDSPNHPTQGKQLQGPSHSDRERPSLSRQHSAHSAAPAEQQATSSPPLRRSGSRRNSIIMSPPDDPGEES
ncbi:hypothetical protein Hypma_000869 [Hypsizygus marmoreus]|uniref:Uncharacterized protein n=1 Tax=Hypsizygus marmoreus TaxID=39966 RepID=A0A369JEN7_HYPMA|nr:hypothetical protein Hypma_000869 [Hypsizygus marmoreus]